MNPNVTFVTKKTGVSPTEDDVISTVSLRNVNIDLVAEMIVIGAADMSFAKTVLQLGKPLGQIRNVKTMN